MAILEVFKKCKILLSLFYNTYASRSMNYDKKHLKLSYIFKIRVIVDQKYLKYKFDKIFKFYLRYI
jgi:hypothetical protein